VPIRLGSISDAALDALVRDAADLELTYDSVGMTKAPPRSSRYHLDRVSTPIDSFERAVTGLRAWLAHRAANSRVAPTNAPIEVGQDVVVVFPMPFVTVLAPCRIVWVVDEPDAFGFGYGTLRGHPEEGEESFVIRRDERGTRFEICALSRPATLTSRIGALVARRVQRRVTNSYLEGIRRAATGEA
jgi:uncharacterized protein (UPF0548 family)